MLGPISLPPSTSPHGQFRVRVLRSGSAGNAVLVEAGPVGLLVDAGLPAELLGREMLSAGATAPLSAILLTHEHDDHARGAAALARATGATILANEATLRAAAPEVQRAGVDVFCTGRPFAVGPVEVTAFSLPHDAAEPVGFSLSCNGTRAVVACDLGEASESLLEHARGADLLLIEANYDLRLMAVSAYPWFLKNRIVSPRGHLSNEGAARVAVAAGGGRPQTVLLVHLSEANNLAPLARDVVREALDAEGLADVRVGVVRPNAGSAWWTATGRVQDLSPGPVPVPAR